MIVTFFCMTVLLSACQFTEKKGTKTNEITLYQVDESVKPPTWEDSYIADEKADGDLRIIQISDPHYYSPRLTDGCTLFQNAMANAAGRDALHIQEILDAFFVQMQQYEPDVLIVSGDLSLNGERASHEDFATYLSQFEKQGIQALVLPGNHDINSTSAWEIRDNTAILTDGVSPEEFEQIYMDFGYGEALYRDKDSLSYVADIGNKCWIMMLDASIYKDNVSQPGGRLSKATRDWIGDILSKAREQKVRVLSSSHQNLLVHNENFVSDYTILDGASLVEKYIEEGVAVNLSGHMHCMNIADRREQFYEVAMESISVWPNLYGQLDVRASGELSFSTHATIHNANSYAYMLDSTNQTLGSRIPDIGLTEEEITSMRDFVVQLNIAYFAGKLESTEYYKTSEGYLLWKEKAPDSRNFAFVESIVQEQRKDHTYIAPFVVE